jgi:hypothetical protein
VKLSHLSIQQLPLCGDRGNVLLPRGLAVICCAEVNMRQKWKEELLMWAPGAIRGRGYRCPWWTRAPTLPSLLRCRMRLHRCAAKGGSQFRTTITFISQVSSFPGGSKQCFLYCIQQIYVCAQSTFVLSEVTSGRCENFRNFVAVDHIGGGHRCPSSSYSDIPVQRPAVHRTTATLPGFGKQDTPDRKIYIVYTSGLGLGCVASVVSLVRCVCSAQIGLRSAI